MIKRIALLLICLLIPLCAFAETPAAAGQYPRNDRGIIQLTVDEAAPYVQRVALTEANWQEYFSNIVQPYHFEVRNEFGDVSLSEEQTLHYFTVTGYDAVHFDEVAFKFGHSIEYSSRGADDNGVVRYSCWERIIAEDGTARLARYYEGEEPTEWSEIDPPQAGYYVARDFTSSSQCHYFDFLGVTGEIVLFSFPDELWTLYGDQEMLYIGDYPLYRHQENNPFLWDIARRFSGVAEDAEDSGEAAPPIDDASSIAGQYPRNDRGIIQLTVDEAAPYVQRVALTEVNWQEYFSNIVQPYHFEVRNEFGDVSLSEEQTLHYFTVTGYDAVHFDEVAFKFGHSIEYSSRGADDNGVVRYACWERIIAEDGTARLARYYEGEEPTEWSEIDPPQAGYYVARDFTSSSRCHYFDFLGVTGEIVLFSFPDELWTMYGDQEMLYIGDYPLYRHQENNPFLWEITRDLFQ